MKKKTEVIDLREFKRGIMGLLKVLAGESLEHQRLDHYSLYSTMQSIVSESTISCMDLELLEDEEEIARMILNFPKDKKN